MGTADVSSVGGKELRHELVVVNGKSLAGLSGRRATRRRVGSKKK